MGLAAAIALTRSAVAQEAVPTDARDALIAAIRNKGRNSNPLASIAARYSVSLPDDDPLDDANFDKIQSKLKNNQKKKKNKPKK